MADYPHHAATVSAMGVPKPEYNEDDQTDKSSPTPGTPDTRDKQEINPSYGGKGGSPQSDPTTHPMTRGA